MTIELSPDGFERIDAQLQAIEELAYDGVFSNGGAPDRCRQITLEVKKLRQLVLEVMLLVPNTVKAPEGEEGAA